MDAVAIITAVLAGMPQWVVLVAALHFCGKFKSFLRPEKPHER